MDLKDLENTSTYAIQAVYNKLWSMIPGKYRLPEDDEKIKEMAPFYDPELSFENRLHYKLTNVDYPKRAKPWFVITWNAPEGILRTSLSQRRLKSGRVTTKNGDNYKFKFQLVELYLTFGVASNSLQAIFELQENLIIHTRDKVTCTTNEHPLLGKFPVSMNVIDSNQVKLPRDKGTLCYLMMQIRVDYPVIGLIESGDGIIETIYSDTNNELEQNLSNDTINENTVIWGQ
jgi:hypothetical protein